MPRFAVWGLICLLVSGAFFVNAATIDLKRRRFLAGAQRAVGAVVVCGVVVCGVVVCVAVHGGTIPP